MSPRVPAVLAVALLAAACGTTPPPAAPAPVVTVTATPPPATGNAADTRPALDDPPPEKTTPEKKRLPNVVGMNLQAAQDTMQATGFFFLSDKDATGQGRFQVWDRGWVVVRQTPPAGKRVPVSTRVVLYAKKRGE